MGEFDFIRRYLQAQTPPADVVLGVGDDAAIVRARSGFDWCFSTDMLLAGRHFFADDAPADIAHKVLAVNLSDMAAMGAAPRWALLAVALPILDDAWLRPFCQHLFALADQYGLTLIGGDTTRGDYVFSVTIAGELPHGQSLRRSSAQPGDDIWLSGQVGLAAAALQHRLGKIRLPESVFTVCQNALRRPVPRVALGQALLPLAHAALDVSDGVAQDLTHILRASDVGAVVRAATLPTLPALRRQCSDRELYPLLLAGGDDYELLFTAPAHRREIIAALALTHRLPLTRIGHITADSGMLHCLAADGRPIHLNQQGYDHFG